MSGAARIFWRRLAQLPTPSERSRRSLSLFLAPKSFAIVLAFLMPEGLIGSNAAWWATKSLNAHQSAHSTYRISVPSTAIFSKISTIGPAKLRTVEISKGGHQFQFRQYIQTGMADVHRRLTRSNF